MKLICILALCFFSIVSVADDQEGFYLGLGGRYIDTGVLSDTGGGIGFSAAEMFTGYKKSKLIGGELRAGVGLNESISFNTEFSVSKFYSLYYRVELANDVAKSFLLLGYTDIEVEATDLETDLTQTAEDSGLSYGAGIGFVVNERVNLNFEYVKLISNDENEFDSAGVNLDFRF